MGTVAGGRQSFFLLDINLQLYYNMVIDKRNEAGNVKGKIIRNSVADQIFYLLKEKIQSGELEEGTKLPSENELAKELGASRISVRAALERLNAFGLTSTKMGEGTFVISQDASNYFGKLLELELLPSDYLQVNQFKIYLEISCLLMLMQKKEDYSKDVELLKQMLEQMRMLLEENRYEEFVELDIKFHNQVGSMTGNKLLKMLYDSMSSTYSEIYPENVKRSVNSSGNNQKLYEYHARIVEIIEKKDWELFHQFVDREDARIYELFDNYGGDIG